MEAIPRNVRETEPQDSISMQDRGTMIATDELLLLPWHASGRLSPRQACRMDAALSRDTDLALHFAIVRQERADTISLNESLGRPSPRALRALFASIDAEPRKKSS